MNQNRRDSECISVIAPAANSLRAAAAQSSLNSRSTRMNAVSSSVFADCSKMRAIFANCARSAGSARRAALRATSRSTSRRTSSKRNWLLTLICDTMMPRRGRIVTSRSRASRCNASRMGVRPMPRTWQSRASETAAPGGSFSVTIISSRIEYAWSVRLGSLPWNKLASAPPATPSAAWVACFTARVTQVYGSSSCLLAPLDEIAEFLVLLRIDRVAVVVVRKLARLHLGDVLRESRDRNLRQVRVPLRELRLEVGENAQQVVAEQDLAVGARTRADADRRDLELLRNDTRDRGRHRFEFEHEAAGVLDGERVGQDLHRRRGGTSLDLEAAEDGNRVRRESDVRGRRNAGIDERLQDMRLRLATLRLDRIAARFLHETGRIGKRAIDGVVALIRHAAEHERVRRTAPHGGRVQHHHVHRRRNRIRMAVRDHREAVADDGDVDAGHLGPACRSVVGDRRVHHLLAGLFRLPDFGDRPLLALR